jgi:hypothetical protein
MACTFSILLNTTSAGFKTNTSGGIQQNAENTNNKVTLFISTFIAKK